MFEQIDDETLDYITCEIDHDLKELGKEVGMDRIRWNNRAMLLAHNRIREQAREIKELKSS